MLSSGNTIFIKNLWIQPMKSIIVFFCTYYLIAKAAFSNFKNG